MIVGGIIGALFIPILSDRYKRRTPFIIIALTGATLGLTGITFATSYWLLLTSGMVLGFFLSKFRTDWISVWSRNNISGIGRDIKRNASAYGTDFRNCIYFWNGQSEVCAHRINDQIAGLSYRIDGSQHFDVIQVEGIRNSEQRRKSSNHNSRNQF